MRAGLRYVQYAPPLKAALARAFIFTIFVSAVWALLAVVAARDLHQGALGYGILNGSMGLGAVVGATSLPHVRRRFSADVIIAISTGVFIGTLLVLAFVRYPLVIIPVLLVRRLLPGRARCPPSTSPSSSPRRAGSRPAPSAPTRWSFPEAWRSAASSGASLPNMSRRLSRSPRRPAACWSRCPSAGACMCCAASSPI